MSHHIVNVLKMLLSYNMFLINALVSTDLINKDSMTCLDRTSLLWHDKYEITPTRGRFTITWLHDQFLWPFLCGWGTCLPHGNLMFSSDFKLNLYADAVWCLRRFCCNYSVWHSRILIHYIVLTSNNIKNKGFAVLLLYGVLLQRSKTFIITPIWWSGSTTQQRSCFRRTNAKFLQP